MSSRLRRLIQAVLELETNGERLEFVTELQSVMCFACGRKDPDCQCDNDE